MTVLIDLSLLGLGFNDISHYFTKHMLPARSPANIVAILCNFAITTQRGGQWHNLTLKHTVIPNAFVKNVWSHAYILLLRYFKITH